MTQRILLSVILLILVPSIQGSDREHLQLTFSAPEAELSKEGYQLQVREADTFLLRENWPAVPVQRILRKYDENTRIIDVSGSAAVTIPGITFDRPFAGNGGIRFLNGRVEPPVYKRLDFGSPFPQTVFSSRAFRGIDPVSMRPAVWLVIDVYPVQLTGPYTACFHPEITVDITVDTRKTATDIRGTSVCYITPDDFMTPAAQLVQHKIAGGIPAQA
ncbi:MAG TPA: hypothetical protein PLV45_14750, partial [bacterium]|nr:hypothetical protein [bacterium]